MLFCDLVVCRFWCFWVLDWISIPMFVCFCLRDLLASVIDLDCLVDLISVIVFYFCLDCSGVLGVYLDSSF